MYIFHKVIIYDTLLFLFEVPSFSLICGIECERLHGNVLLPGQPWTGSWVNARLCVPSREFVFVSESPGPRRFKFSAASSLLCCSCLLYSFSSRWMPRTCCGTDLQHYNLCTHGSPLCPNSKVCSRSANDTFLSKLRAAALVRVWDYCCLDCFGFSFLNTECQWCSGPLLSLSSVQ